MNKTHLLQAVCAVAILAATPALAQRPEAGMTGPTGAPNPEATHPAPATGTKAPANDGADTTSLVTPKDTQTATGTQYTHRPVMSHKAGAMHSQDNTSQNAEVDRLNDESYQAAQQGQTFTIGAADTGTSGTAAPTGTMPAPAAGGSK
jgi:hypothetical protein